MEMIHLNKLIILSVVHSLFLLVGCGPSNTTDTEYPVTVQGIHLTEVFRIGDQESDDVLFGEISDMDVNSKGEIFVVDSRIKSVYMFTDEGSKIRDIGRSGRGPGEFSGPVSVHVTKGDSLYIFDRILNRVSVFNPENTVVSRTFSVPGSFSMGLPSSLLGSSERGILFKYITPFVDPSQSDPKAPRYDKIYSLDFQGNNPNDPVLRVLARDFITTTSAGGGISARRMPFGRSSVVRYSNHDGHLYAGRNNSIDVDLISVADGLIVKSLQLTIPNIPITEFDRDSVISGITGEEERQLVRSAEWPESQPAFETFLVDDNGSVWFKRTMPSPSTNAEWLILNKSGQLASVVQLPKEVVLDVIKQSRLYGYGVDTETGAPYLICYVIR